MTLPPMLYGSVILYPPPLAFQLFSWFSLLLYNKSYRDNIHRDLFTGNLVYVYTSSSHHLHLSGMFCSLYRDWTVLYFGNYWNNHRAFGLGANNMIKFRKALGTRVNCEATSYT